MDLPTSPTTPLGPMIIARARAMENEVNSLLVELPFDPLETWLLPQTEMLCVLRYHVSNQGEVTMQEVHQEHEEHHPSSEVPEQPPMHRPTSAWAVQPVGHRSTTGQAPDIKWCKAGTSPVYPCNSHQTGTTAPGTGTTAERIRERLQEPVPELPVVQPPP